MAPARASPPPASHTRMIELASGRICATMLGTKKLPPPMTLETTIAAASKGPRRRSSEGVGGDVTRSAPASSLDQLTRDGVFGDFRPLGGTVLREELDLGVDEL